MTGDTYISKLVILLTLGKSEFPFISFYYFGQVTVILLSLVGHVTKNNPNPRGLIKIPELSVGSGTFQIIFNNSISRNQELVFVVNKWL